MNYIWPLMVIVSLVFAFFNQTLDRTVAEGLKAAEASVTTLLSLGGMMCFWSGILKIAEEGGLVKKIEKIFSPVTGRLFPRLEKGGEAIGKITANISANLIGVGNAATPAGISAMSELDRLNKHPYTPSEEMCIFTVMNTASIQLIPTTIISIRASLGSENAEKIILPVWICSFLSLAAAVGAMKLILYFEKRKKR